MARDPFWTPPGGPARVAPSLLSADFANLRRDVERIRDVASALHLDVMDGHFVPNITFGPPLVACVRAVDPDAYLDCHLMIEEPLRYAEAFVTAGADLLSIHAELFHDASHALRRIRKMGVAAGLAVNPDTPLERVADALPDVDLLVVMSVFPGFGGQAFIESSVDKVREAAEVRASRGMRYAIEVDGGVSPENAGALIEAGADALVAGSAIFGAADPRAAAGAIASPGRVSG